MGMKLEFKAGIGSGFRVCKLPHRLAGVTHTFSLAACPSPGRTSISTCHPPRRLQHNWWSSLACNSSNAEIRSLSGRFEASIHDFFSTATLQSKNWSTALSFRAPRRSTAARSNSWEASRSAASCTEKPAYTRVLFDNDPKIASTCKKMDLSTWRRWKRTHPQSESTQFSKTKSNRTSFTITSPPAAVIDSITRRRYPKRGRQTRNQKTTTYNTNGQMGGAAH